MKKGLNLRIKLILAFLLVALEAFIFLGLINFILVSDALVKANDTQMEAALISASNISVTSHKLIQQTINNDINMLLTSIKNNIYLSPSETLRMTAVNQANPNMTHPVALRELVISGAPISKSTAFIDNIAEIMDCSVTLLQWIPEGLLRVSTSAKSHADEFALGSYIPKDSPIIEKIKKGEGFYGKAFVVDTWYITAYLPLYDNTKQIIGAISIGLPFTRLKEMMRDNILSIKIGENGYAEIFDHDAVQVIHKDALLEGSLRNSQTHQEMIAKQNGSIRAKQNSDANNRKGEMKVYRFGEVKELEWMIAVSGYESEIFEPINQLRLVNILFIIVGLIGIIVFGILFSNSIVRSIRLIISRLKNINSETERANLSERIITKSHDEIGEIVSEINYLISKLNIEMVGVEAVSERFDRLSVQSKEIIDQKIKNEIRIINQSIKDIDSQAVNATSGIEQLSSNLEELVRNIDSIMRNMERQASAVEEGASSIEEMVRNIENTTSMSNKSTAISNNLNAVANDGVKAVNTAINSIKEVAEYSQQILKILQLITNIAKQTNLLAMNAAIEAAHAGEAGKGFAIVADEIRRLSEDTNKNAKEINDVVGFIVTKIADSVKLAENTGVGLQTIMQFSNQNSQIIGQLNVSMEEQNNGAKEILRSTQELVQITEDVKMSMLEQKSATDEFSNALNELRDFTLNYNNGIKSHLDAVNGLIASVRSLEDNTISNQKLVSELRELLDKFELDKTQEEKTELKLVE